MQEELRSHIARGGTITEELQETQHILAQWETWIEPAERTLRTLRQRHQDLHRKADRHLARAEAKEEVHQELARKTEIYTVDVELDAIMTAYKLTFMNLASTLMSEHQNVHWQLDHLIQAVLTLPGRRRQTPNLEVIELFRQPRDPATMEAVERACKSLNARELRRGPRLLRFSVIDRPHASR